jgi:hypothetical protein
MIFMEMLFNRYLKCVENVNNSPKQDLSTNKQNGSLIRWKRYSFPSEIYALLPHF